MKKKLVALMLCAALLVSAVSGALAQSSGDVTKLVMMFMTWTGAPADTQAVQDAINAITVEKLGIEVDLQISDVGAYRQSVQLALSGGEQVDLLTTILLNYPSLVAQGYLSDLEENNLLTTYGAGIVSSVGQAYIDACRVGGKLYGLPNNRDMAQGRGCAAVATEYLDGIGYQVPADQKNSEIVKISLDELNDIYARLHVQYPSLEVYRPVKLSMQQFSNVDFLGGSSFGVLTDYGSSMDVVNLFDTDFYRAYCQRIYGYNQKGYISPDATTDTTAVTELVKAGTLMSYTTGGKPGIRQQETNMCGRPMTIFQTLDNYISSNAVAQFPWTIPINTVNAEKAMTLLNEFYTNPALANLLSWGIEGKHYKVLDTGLIDFADGVNAGNATWNPSVGWEMPNEYITYVWNGNALDLWKQLADFNTSAKKSLASGFTFDSTNTATELTAVQNVYDEYLMSLEYGFVDPATGIPEMNAKMMDAGLQKIIDDKATQLAAWAALTK